MEEADKLSDKEVVICCTGAQWERYAALMRIATGESKDTILKPDDTVIFSSSVIPGNERNVQLLYDLIYEQWPRVYHYKESEIHAWWHARSEDTKKMISLIQPEVYIPIYGFPHMLYGNARNARYMWIPQSLILLSKNWQVIEFTKDSFQLTSQFVPHSLVTVDGYTVGMTKESQLYERFQISSQGIFMVSIAKKPWKFLYEMETIGMPDMWEFPVMKKKIEILLDEILKTSLSKFPTAEHFKKFVTKKIQDLIFDEIGKEPLVKVLVH